MPSGGDGLPVDSLIVADSSRSAEAISSINFGKESKIEAQENIWKNFIIFNSPDRRAQGG
jgi:hypothetical protein